MNWLFQFLEVGTRYFGGHRLKWGWFFICFSFFSEIVSAIYYIFVIWFTAYCYCGRQQPFTVCQSFLSVFVFCVLLKVIFLSLFIITMCAITKSDCNILQHILCCNLEYAGTYNMLQLYDLYGIVKTIHKKMQIIKSFTFTKFKWFCKLHHFITGIILQYHSIK